ncbi:hypothetical protein [Arthrobacter sp. Z1-15]
MAEKSPKTLGEHAARGQHIAEPSIHASPDEYELGALAWASRASQSLGSASHPFLASIERQTMEELPDGSVIAGAEGGVEGVPLYKESHYKFEWIVPLDEALDFDLDQFITRLYIMSEEHASRLTKSILNHISAVSEEYGQVVNAEGRPFFDVICDSLEKLEFVFDDEGNHNIRLMLNPDDAKLFASITPEQQLVLDQIVQRKREEWNAKRRRRNFPRIPD